MRKHVLTRKSLGYLLLVIFVAADMQGQTVCTDESACNFGLPSAMDGCLYPNMLFEHGDFKDCTGQVLTQNDLNSNGLPDAFEIAGCRNPHACNFNSEATLDDSCDFDSCLGCTDELAFNYAVEVFRDVNNCIPMGCMDSSSIDYDPEAQKDDGSCRYFDCFDPLACNAEPYDRPGIYISIACQYDCVGCRSDIACNYDPSVDIHDEDTCDYACLDNDTSSNGSGSGCAIPEACNYVEGLKFHKMSDCTFPVCKDPVACNYAEENGCHSAELCEYASDLYSSGIYDCTGHCISDADDDGICDENEITGCTDALACNFSYEATEEDGTCDFGCTVCRNPFACNYVNTGLSNPDLCTYDCGGCTDSEACNFNATAEYNDGSCRYISAQIVVNPVSLPPIGGWDLPCSNDLASEIHAHIYGPSTNTFALLWSNGEFSNIAHGLSSGEHTLSVDHSTCSSVLEVSISSPPSLTTTSSSSQDISCADADDGSANAMAIGGTQPYEYLWENGSNTASISNLGPGEYGFIVTDANNCSANGSVSISEPDALMVSLQIEGNISCAGTNDGIIVAQASGGTDPYAYVWNTGFVGATIGSISAGEYVATVTDSNGCIHTNSIDLIDAIASGLSPQVEIKSIHHPDCYGGKGSVVIDTSMSLAPIKDWNWSHLDEIPSHRDSVGNLEPGHYFLTLSSPSGCGSAVGFEIESAETFHHSNVRALAASGSNHANGKIMFDVEGPDLNYEIFIIPSDTSIAAAHMQFENRLKSSDYELGLLPGSYTLHNLQETETGCSSIDIMPSVVIVPQKRLN